MQNIAADATALNLNDFLMAKDMAEALHAHYPGHQWAVTCDGTTGLATIRNLMLSGHFGYVLKLPEIYSASAFRKHVIMAGGEVLERFQVARSEFDEAAYTDLKTDFAGRLEYQK